MKNGKCPAGEYYCYTNKECKPIPKGFMVGRAGMLRKENGHSVDDTKKNGSGNGNGNGNGGNGNGSGNGGSPSGISEEGLRDEQDIEMHMNKMKSSALHKALDKKKINIILPGVLNFYEDTVFVGEQIMINLPRAGGDLDKVTSGPYVVLEVKHKFSENKYSHAMTCRIFS